MSTKTNNNTTTANDSELEVLTIDSDILSSIGITRTTDREVRNAKARIKSAGGFVPASMSDNFALIAGSVPSNYAAAQNAGRKVSLALAIMDKSGEYLTMTGPDGKTFKNVNQLFAAMYPSLAESTRRNYIATGNKVYLPAVQGDLNKSIEFLNNVEPGTAMFANSIIGDKAKEDKFAEAIRETAKNPAAPTQSEIKRAVKAAKGETTDTTKPTKAKDAKAAADTEIEEMRVALKRILNPDKLEDEYHMTIQPGDVSAWKELLTKAVKDPTKAVCFVKAIAKAVDVK